MDTTSPDYISSRVKKLNELHEHEIVVALTHVISGSGECPEATTSSSAGGPALHVQPSPSMAASGHVISGEYPLAMTTTSSSVGVLALHAQPSPSSGNPGGIKKYKGVRQRPSGRWGAEIRNRHKAPPNEWLGTYNTPEEAAMAYDRAAIRLHGPQARLNFPDLLHHYQQQNPPGPGDG